MKRMLCTILALFIVVGCTKTFPLVTDTRVSTPSPTWTAVVNIPPTFTPVATATPEATPACLDIKGNIDRKGVKRYFTKQSINYKNVKAEKMFCDEQAAKDAGFVKAGK